MIDAICIYVLAWRGSERPSGCKGEAPVRGVDRLGELGEILRQRPDMARRLERLEALRELDDRFLSRSVRIVVLDSGTGSTTGALAHGNVSGTDQQATPARR